jgi:hypothetical protein
MPSTDAPSELFVPTPSPDAPIFAGPTDAADAGPRPAPFRLGRLFDALDSGDGPLLSAGRGSVGSIRGFRLPFIPDEVADGAAEEVTEEDAG